MDKDNQTRGAEKLDKTTAVPLSLPLTRCISISLVPVSITYLQAHREKVHSRFYGKHQMIA
jgi:hypothetical protein